MATYSSEEIDQLLRELSERITGIGAAVGAKIDEEVAHVRASVTSLVGDAERRLLADDQALEQRLAAAQSANDLMLEQRLVAASRADDQALEARVVGSFSAIANQLTSAAHHAQAALEQRLALPRGTIVMWSGSIQQVPAGWTVCDGRNGSPDLRDRFIVGAGTEAPGASGPGEKHEHTVPALNGSGRAGDAGEHQHKLPGRWYGRSLDDGGKRGIDTGGGTFDVDNPEHFIQPAGTHSHAVSTTTTATRLPQVGVLRPRWYALCFVMKL